MKTNFCGNCENFHHEDSNGTGLCYISDTETNCNSEACNTHKQKQTHANCESFGKIYCGASQGKDFYEYGYCFKCTD